MKLTMEKHRTDRLPSGGWRGRAGRRLRFPLWLALIPVALMPVRLPATDLLPPTAPGLNMARRPLRPQKNGDGVELLNDPLDLMKIGNGRDGDESALPVPPSGGLIQVTRETNGTFTVENHFCLTDARACKFSWQLWKYPMPDETDFRITVLREGTVESPAIPPGGHGVLKISAAASPNADALALRVDDPRGRELRTWVWPLKSTGAARLADDSSEQHAVPCETNGVILVQTGDLTVMFSQQTGRLTAVRRGAQDFSLTNGPRPAAGRAILREIHFDDDGPDAVIAARYDGDLKFVLWRVFNNGWVKCRCTYAATGTNDFSGIRFDYPENLVRHKRWVGDGPNRVWKNRRDDATPGCWENNITNITPRPDGGRDGANPGFKGFFANVDWLQLDTTEGPITVVPENVSFVQVLTPEFPPTEPGGRAGAAGPECGLGFLDVIPSLRGKFPTVPVGDPPGHADVTNEEHTVTVDFYFGKLTNVDRSGGY
jgi:hypothetical protein